VEDNEVARQGLAAVLRREGYRVTLAGNGQQALDCLDAGPTPDLILLNMVMPVLDGWHFLERLKGEGRTPPIPIVIATATTSLTREWAKDHGCQGFLRKPIEADGLLEEVRRCLGQAGTPVAPA